MSTRERRSILSTPVWFFMVIVFITQLDGGAVPTMLPSITRTFGLTTMGSSWVVGLYTLGLVVGTPITSNLSDAHGTRKVFLWELAFWFLGCLMTAVSPNYVVMLLGRFIQSLGDSGIMVLSMNVLLQRARRNNQGRKVSTVGIIAGLSAMVSPVLSGMLLGITHGWRAYYFLMLPFLAVLFILSLFMMGDSQTDRVWKTDYLGLGSFSIALALLMVAITFLQYGTAYLALIIGCLLVAVVAGVIFLVHERNLDGSKETMPFLPIHLLKLPSYGLTLLLGTLGGMFFSLFVYIPTYVHSVFGLPVRSAGMVMVGVGLGSVVGSWLGGLLVDKFGYRTTLVFSSSLIGLMALMITLTLHNLQLFMVLSFLMGVGMGSMMSSPLQVIAGRLAGPENRMQAIGGLSACKKIGTTIAPLLFASSIELGKVGGQAGLASYRNMFLVVIVITLVNIGLTYCIPFSQKEVAND
ncbi:MULTISPECIES: MFS transporter [Bifidobacterium]|uniref:MFS transporter n=1 Tax=Bifidobacterium asteroides TaxID=1684 RepID=A0A556RC99_9BIFI|nr:MULTISPECIES: MFS transporter [Bifidobacterium]MBI0086032.1 MFS transporter [Bifidobacterium sp. M0404]TSJ86512.1 MFS transporter [Bifidobacterium polysaccharolyticum]